MSWYMLQETIPKERQQPGYHIDPSGTHVEQFSTDTL